MELLLLAGQRVGAGGQLGPAAVQGDALRGKPPLLLLALGQAAGQLAFHLLTLGIEAEALHFQFAGLAGVFRTQPACLVQGRRLLLTILLQFAPVELDLARDLAEFCLACGQPVAALLVLSMQLLTNGGQLLAEPGYFLMLTRNLVRPGIQLLALPGKVRRGRGRLRPPCQLRLR